MTTNVRDPKSIITPDAFSVSEELLGLPLASPRRRLLAIVIDLFIVAYLTSVTQSVGVFVWGIIGAFLLQMAFRKKQAQSQLGQVTSVVFRGATGCLGLTILAVVALLTLSQLFEDDIESAARGIQQAIEEAEQADGEGLPEAQVALQTLTDTLSRDGLVLALSSMEAAGDEASDSVSPAEGIRVSREEWRAALDLRAAELFAGDRIEELESDLEAAERRSRGLRAELDAAEEKAASGLSGLAALGSDVVNQLGSAFGVWSLYFTISLVLLNGRTVGKLLTRMRVLRLDGQKFTWWAALERSGGYVAGLATGLLGFVQIFWDRNRQCVHDKIVGTVVVMDGIAAEPGAWKEVWDASQKGD